jgi:hypothetical protein
MFASISSRKLLAAGLATIAFGASAMASVTDPFLHVTASNASGSGTFDVPLADVTMNANGSFSYVLPAPVQIMSGPNVIAEITAMTSFVRPLTGGLPNLISVGFTFFAGTSTTTFTVDSTLLTINPIMGEGARTSAGFTITDMDGNGATMAGTNGPGSFVAQYNGNTQFANVLPGTAVGPGGSQTMNAALPGGGAYTSLGNVDSMSSHWGFTLTGNDQVGVTSVWEVIPAPGTLALMGLASLSLSRRSRR